MKICPICQKEYKQLSIQHFNTHGLKTSIEIKTKFPGIDLGNDKSKQTAKEKIITNAINNKFYCKQCGKIIVSLDRKKRKFCSSECAGIYNNAHRTNKYIDKVCACCGKIFKSNRFLPHTKFCSQLCSQKNRRSERINKFCEFCKTEFSMKKRSDGRSKYYFCSNFCKNSFFKNKPEERGVFSGHNGKSRLTKYRMVAFDKFEHKCNYCGYNKHIEVLQVHHKDKNRENNIIDNLEIVCPTCHAESHLGLI